VKREESETNVGGGFEVDGEKWSSGEWEEVGEGG